MLRPLRVTWTFAAPVVMTNDYLLHLDALVAYSIYEEATEAGASNAVELSEDMNHVFQSMVSPTDSVWSASAVCFTPAAEIFTTTMVRRSEPEAFMQAQDSGLLHGRKRSLLETGKGPNRAYFIHHPYQWMKKATAWCLADELELKNALSRIQALGKMTRNGFGRIASTTIEHDEVALDKWKLRYLPLDMDGAAGIEYATTKTCCLRPPYWERSKAVPSKEPVF